MDFDFVKHARGEYDGALSHTAIGRWAREHDVEIDNQPNPSIFGARIITARLDGCEGTGATKLEALHLLYYVWRDPANRSEDASHERGAT